MDGEIVMGVNTNQFLNFEFERTMREHFRIFNKVPYDASF